MDLDNGIMIICFSFGVCINTLYWPVNNITVLILMFSKVYKNN